MQKTPHLGMPIGMAMLNNPCVARLVLDDMEGGVVIQNVMDRCAARYPEDRPKIDQVLMDLQNVRHIEALSPTFGGTNVPSRALAQQTSQVSPAQLFNSKSSPTLPTSVSPDVAPDRGRRRTWLPRSFSQFLRRKPSEKREKRQRPPAWNEKRDRESSDVLHRTVSDGIHRNAGDGIHRIASDGIHRSVSDGVKKDQAMDVATESDWFSQTVLAAGIIDEPPESFVGEEPCKTDVGAATSGAQGDDIVSATTGSAVASDVPSPVGGHGRTRAQAAAGAVRQVAVTSREAVAIYDWFAQQPGQLSLRVGDIVRIHPEKVCMSRGNPYILCCFLLITLYLMPPPPEGDLVACSSLCLVVAKTLVLL